MPVHFDDGRFYGGSLGFVGSQSGECPVGLRADDEVKAFSALLNDAFQSGFVVCVLHGADTDMGGADRSMGFFRFKKVFATGRNIGTTSKDVLSRLSRYRLFAPLPGQIRLVPFLSRLSRLL